MGRNELKDGMFLSFMHPRARIASFTTRLHGRAKAQYHAQRFAGFHQTVCAELHIYFFGFQDSEDFRLPYINRPS